MIGWTENFGRKESLTRFHEFIDHPFIAGKYGLIRNETARNSLLPPTSTENLTLPKTNSNFKKIVNYPSN